MRYLGTGVVRVPIRVQYFGQVYADRDVPWHYPWFYFAATVPVGLHLLGALGLIRGWRDRRTDPFPLLLAGSIGLFLLVFSTRVPVYDGERLFLVVFPALDDPDRSGVRDGLASREGPPTAPRRARGGRPGAGLRRRWPSTRSG
jgi:hypothetical protein